MGWSAGKVDDVTACRIQDGGYALLWQRYDNNKMAAIFYIFNSTVIDWTCLFFFKWSCGRLCLLRHKLIAKNFIRLILLSTTPTCRLRAGQIIICDARTSRRGRGSETTKSDAPRKSWFKFAFGRNINGKVFGILSWKKLSKSNDVLAQNKTF